MRISDWSSDVCSSDLPWDHTRSSASAPMAAKGPWPCLSGVDCPGSTTGDAALSSALVERDVETLVAALIAAFFIFAGLGGRVRPFQFRLRDRERHPPVGVGPPLTGGGEGILAPLHPPP